jgi:cysteine-rich repeat protein
MRLLILRRTSSSSSSSVILLQLLLLLPLLLHECDAALTYCWDVPSISPPSSLPLCGNGQLDLGEVCDDGNRQSGDGCNAFCSAFDAMAATGILAGGTTPCPRGRPLVGNTLSTTFFCNLRALEPTPDGGGVLLADGGTLLRFDLFTDAVTGTIVPLAASIEQTMVAICSMAYMKPDDTLLIHDCGSGQFFVASASGAHVQPVADFTDVLAVADTRAYYNRTARTAVIAATLRKDTLPPTDGCVGVYGLTLSPFSDDWTLTSTRTAIATLPCTVYGVYEDDAEGTRWTSMDLRGMVPYLVTHDRCPPTLRLNEWCYVIYMQRPSHLDLMRAYLPEEGGLDIQYYAKTVRRFDNALGAPLVRPSLTDPRRIYTLRGACLSMEQRLVTSDGKTPPVVTLGNTCKRAPQLGLDCTTPLNNAFVNDVMSSSSLLPLGLSANHTHAELTAIFNATCTKLADVSSAGPLLYQSVLASVYGNTTPVDLVELPRTLDVIYITPTAVGLISTKRIHFADRAQTGYVRATDLIYCPKGQFGQVASGVCRPCNEASAPGYYVSIAWQIQCAPSKDAAPYETFTIVTGPETTSDLLHAHACVYTESRNVSCPDRIDLTPPQVFNLDGDLHAAPVVVAASADAVSLIPCLIAAASNALGVSLFRINRPEFLARAVVSGRTLITAAAAKPMPNANFSDTDLAAQSLSACGNTLAKGLGSFLACATPRTVNLTSGSDSSGGTRRRRLLQQQPQADGSPLLTPIVTAHHDVVMGSTAYVSYTRVLPLSDANNKNGQASGSTNDNNAPNANKTDASATAFPIAIAIGVGVGCTVVVCLLAAIFMSFGRSDSKNRPRTEARFVASFPSSSSSYSSYASRGTAAAGRGRIAGKRSA